MGPVACKALASGRPEGCKRGLRCWPRSPREARRREGRSAMKRFAKGAVVLATIPLLLVGFASAALAGGAAHGSGVSTMRPFTDPNYPILAQPAARGVQPESPSSSLPLVALVAGLTALVAAAGALLTIGWRRRLRPA